MKYPKPTLIGLAAIFKVDVLQLNNEYHNLFNHRVKTRGKKDAVNFFRSLLLCGERYALHQKIDPIPWTKSDGDNFPSILRNFKPYLRSRNSYKVIFALSVLRNIETSRLEISKDISSVTEPSLSNLDTERDIINFIDKVHWNKPLRLRRLKYHMTLKKGPNGPALESSDADVSGLLQNPALFEAIQTVQNKLGGPHPLNEDFKRNDKSFKTLSKLTQFPEKAGKTRTIAIIDYYSQRALRPLHKALMARLRSLRSDGTYSHRNVGKWAKEQTLQKKYLFCADLSAATDRFPSSIQRELLFKLVPDRELATALWTILAERTFTVDWSGEEVKYEVGQPMGAYSSWPLFSLAHHLTIEYCFGSSNCQDEYRSIGDDFVTRNEEQASTYKRVMKELGVQLSTHKCVESPLRSRHSAAEVAKQLYLNGTNLTPLTPGFVRDIMKPHMFNMCLDELMTRYNSVPEPAILIKKLFGNKPKVFRRVWCLASNPVDGAIKPSDEGYENHSPWFGIQQDVFEQAFKEIMLYRLEDKTNEIYQQYWDDVKEDYFQGVGDPLLPIDNIRGSPWQDSHRRTDAQLHMEEGIREQLNEIKSQVEILDVNYLSINDPCPIGFIPDPRVTYRPRKEQRNIHRATLIEIVGEVLQMQ